MANLTITVDEQVLKRARIRALQRNESVNRYLAEALQRYADHSGDDVVDALTAIVARAHTGHVGDGRGWARDDLHRD